MKPPNIRNPRILIGICTFFCIFNFVMVLTESKDATCGLSMAILNGGLAVYFYWKYGW